ncbi:MAG TPA: hypothetical protein DEA08_09535 [Planctomycetes bacterium]|nr:hypothetical protein [Planctomycetota bacterium]
MLAEGQALEARRLLEELPALDLDPRLHATRGRLRAQDDLVGAVVDLFEAREGLPAGPEREAASAALEALHQGPVREQRARFEEDPRSARQLLQGDSPEAELRSARDLLALYPAVAELYANRASAQRRLGELAQGVADLRVAVALSPRQSRIWVLLADAWQRAGEPERALAALDGGLRANPGRDGARLLERRGTWAMQAAGELPTGDERRATRYQAALDDFGRAIELDAQCMVARYNRASIRATILEDHVVALEELRGIVAETSPDWRVLRLLGRESIQVGVLSSEPKRVEEGIATLERAQALARAGGPPDALRRFAHDLSAARDGLLRAQQRAKLWGELPPPPSAVAREGSPPSLGEARRAFVASPSDPGARRELAAAYLAVGAHGDALLLLLEALPDFDLDPRQHDLRARLRLVRKDVRGEVVDLLGALVDSFEAHGALPSGPRRSELTRRLKELYDGPVAAAQRRFAADPLVKRVEPHYEDPRQGLSVYQAMVRAHPLVSALRVNRGSCRKRLGDLAGWLEDARVGVALGPGSDQIWALLGRAFADNGQLERALQALGRGLEHLPQGAQIYEQRGMLHQVGFADRAADRKDVAVARKHYEAALADYERAIELRPQCFNARFNHAMLLANVFDRPAEALAELRSLNADQPDQWLTLLKLGQLSSGLERPSEAVAWLERSLACAQRAGEATAAIEAALTLARRKLEGQER